MIRDLNDTLKTMLKQELPAGMKEMTITFAAPDKTFPPATVTLPAIDFFLYDVREHRDLRSVEGPVERQGDGTAIRRPPAVRVACSYLVTGWPSEGSPEQDEHQFIEEIMKVLLRFPVLPEGVLQGSLAGQEPPLRAMALLPGQITPSEFWHTLEKFKLALHYTVIVSLRVDDGDETDAVVTGPPPAQGEEP